MQVASYSRLSAQSAIGRAIARQLASTPAFAVVLLGCDLARAREAAAAIRQESGNEQVSYVVVDVARQREIEAPWKHFMRLACSTQWRDPAGDQPVGCARWTDPSFSLAATVFEPPAATTVASSAAA